MDGLHHLSIDIETYSDVEISKTGLYRYVQSPAFEVLLFGYSLDGAPPRVIDLARGEQIPPEIVQHCMSPYTLKHAYVAAGSSRLCGHVPKAGRESGAHCA